LGSQGSHRSRLPCVSIPSWPISLRLSSMASPVPQLFFGKGAPLDATAVGKAPTGVGLPPPSENNGSQGKGPSMKGKAPPLVKGAGGKGPARPKAGSRGPPVLPGVKVPPGGAAMLTGPKLKPLFWTVLREVQQESLWASLEPPAPFDQAQLESRFKLLETKARSLTPGARTPRGSEDAEAQKRVRILDGKTSQNLAIKFKWLPPPDHLATVIDALEGFPDCLPSEGVLALHAAVSEQREPIEQLRHMDLQPADVVRLDLPERYLRMLGSVPLCAEKLACGALIVGPAHEVKDYHNAASMVTTCCRALRETELLQRCISTCFAVGNFMNRGTNRIGAGIVLPDSLLKLNELRSTLDDEDTPNSTRGDSLLDIVAQALVDDPRNAGRDAEALRTDVEELRLKVKAGRSVSLEEIERRSRSLCVEAERTWTGAQALPPSTGTSRLLDKVGQIRAEANDAHKLVKESQSEIQKTRCYLSAKDAKDEDWLTRWLSFLEQLERAFEKVKSTRGAGAIPKNVRTTALMSQGSKQLDAGKPPTSSAPPAVLSSEDLPMPTTQPVPARASTAPLLPAPLAPSVLQPRQQMYDEDARIEDLFKSTKTGHSGRREAAPRRSPPVALDMEDKENRP